jgi:hypothetical protein
MAGDDKLLVTYGLGYAFEKSKLLIISEIENKIVLKHELNIMEEINSIRKLKQNFCSRCNLKFPNDYISNIEETLEEKLSNTIPIITSIKSKDKNMEKQVDLMKEYSKIDLSQARLIKEGYVRKDSSLVKNHLEKYITDPNIGVKKEEKIFSKYNKLILKLILTTSFGTEFSDFLNKEGQANILNEENKIAEDKLKNHIKNNFLIKKKYNELDFLNLLLFLQEWEQKYFIWDGKYTSLMFSINKDGERYKRSNSEIKDFMVSFIKEKRYLYFPFGRYNDQNVFITLNDEMYHDNENKENYINVYNKQSNVILEKKESNLYKITPVKYEEINLKYSKQIGALLSYNNDEVYISLVSYDEKDEKITSINKFEKFEVKMIEVLKKCFII